MPADAETARLDAQLVVRLTTDESAHLGRLASADDRPVATYVRRVLRQHLSAHPVHEHAA